MYLFFDSSEYLSLGLLNEDLNWADFKRLTTKKNSEIFHGCLFEMLSQNKLKLADVQAVFQVAGPGSYTGMRLSEGMCQLLEWHGIRVYSFYHFQVPRILGASSGAWISEAFKGDFFLYSWDGENNKVQLIPKAGRSSEEIVSALSSDYPKIYTHYDMGTFDCGFTADMIKDHAKELFSYIKEYALREKPYYYRALEQEFKPSLKG